MTEKYTWQKIISLIKSEVVPAIGCTEPIAVAFTVARACEVLGQQPDKIEVALSANILKNAMGVGIPGTDMIGLPIAVALGSLIGRSEYGLEVLRDTNPEAVDQGRALIESGAIHIELKEPCDHKLYIKVKASLGDSYAEVIVAEGHTNIVFESLNGTVSLDTLAELNSSLENEEHVDLDLKKVYDFAMEAPLEDIEFILEAKELNMAAAQSALEGDYGHSVGRAISCPEHNKMMFGSTPFTRILAHTSAACDARMAGALIPVMSNSGSGNQGISATIPVVVYAQECNASHEQMVRALTLSHLTAIYIKQSLGRLSALCGCIVAATGSSCGITYLMGGDFTQMCYAVKNMIANLTGMICDGAKPSCALKISSGVSTAVLSAVLAMEGRCVSSVEGIIEEDVDRCITNLTTIGRQGMDETDQLVLDIMTHKCN